jgi:hypothetical protein
VTRTKRSKLTFSRAFTLEGAECSFPAGVYELVTDEELIEGLSFPAYRRVASWILALMQNSNNSTEMIMVDPVELAAAHARDVAGTNSLAECVVPAIISKAE